MGLSDDLCGLMGSFKVARENGVDSLMAQLPSYGSRLFKSCIIQFQVRESLAPFLKIPEGFSMPEKENFHPAIPVDLVDNRKIAKR